MIYRHVRTDTIEYWDVTCPHCRRTTHKPAMLEIKRDEDGEITQIKLDCPNIESGQDRT